MAQIGGRSSSRKWSRRILAAAMLVVIAAAASAGAAPGAQPHHRKRLKPIRAAFYYPWYPGTWHKDGALFTKYTPSLGFYSSWRRSLIRHHIRAMEYAGLGAAISSWWGPRTPTDEVFKRILKVSASTSETFRWSVYYEAEGQGDPSVEQIRSDLHYLRSRYWSRPNYLRVRNRPVVFVYGDPGDDCGMVSRWRAANDVGAYVVLKIFPGYEHCGAQPPGWHQYAPIMPAQRAHRFSYSISPGFWRADEATPRLVRDLVRWRQDVRAMRASRARFQLVTTFNEWGEGTAVESAWQWRSPSHFGLYLDVMHQVLNRAHAHRHRERRCRPRLARC